MQETQNVGSSFVSFYLLIRWEVVVFPVVKVFCRQLNKFLHLHNIYINTMVHQTMFDILENYMNTATQLLTVTLQEGEHYLLWRNLAGKLIHILLDSSPFSMTPHQFAKVLEPKVEPQNCQCHGPDA